MARNPVMLTALAVVHWNENRLPEQRAELYSSVIRWLLRAREQKPGRASSEVCERRFRKLALAMQNHPEGRRVQVPKRWAAEAIEETFDTPTEDQRIEQAEQFLDQEEIDSGVLNSEGRDVSFWHLTFQEYLAARAIAGLGEDKQFDLLLTGEKLYQPEWREVMLLLGGVLHDQGREKVDALFVAVLKGLDPGAGATLSLSTTSLPTRVITDDGPQDTHAAGLLVKKRTLEAVMGIFDADKSKRYRVPSSTRSCRSAGASRRSAAR